MPCWRGDFHSPAASRLACLRGLRGAVRVNTRGGTLGNLRANGASSPDSARPECVGARAGRAGRRIRLRHPGSASESIFRGMRRRERTLLVAEVV